MLAEGLGNCEHELMLFKRMDSCHIFTFYGFEVENDTCLVEVEAKPARRIGAELHDIAQGGAALLDGTGWFAGPDFIGMESIFDKIQFYPELSEPVKWDFQAYRPHVVIVAIGQNDANPEDYMAADYEGERAVHWRNSYRDFIGRLREIYPKAEIVLSTTILGHDAGWDRAIGQVCEEIWA